MVCCVPALIPGISEGISPPQYPQPKWCGITANGAGWTCLGQRCSLTPGRGRRGDVTANSYVGLGACLQGPCRGGQDRPVAQTSGSRGSYWTRPRFIRAAYFLPSTGDEPSWPDGDVRQVRHFMLRAPALL
ncbi:hypothetical protein NDU88_005311 [Pleurodeles waltl]|uniref:Uncharacterized protein n=1 Tax=Pleurodeles waltl TaxID=8319 RepID=A0AAV7WBF6_PLEWA|nr:hypothetical protein NDU88_005311 [Pleurodeles waltl]